MFMDADTEISAAEKLCSVLGIDSRSELNGNKVAQEKFDALIKQYEANNDPF